MNFHRDNYRLRIDRPPRLSAVSVAVPVVTAVVIGDQLTKAVAAHGGLVAHNPAYALGVIGGPAPLLIAGTAIVLIAFFALIARPAVAIGVSPIIPALIAGGMLGNALDRIRYGAARDFLRTPWAIVNLADLAVAAGIVALVISLAWHVYQPRPASISASARTGGRAAHR